MEKKKIAIIGAGISGLSVARLLNVNNDVVVFEKEATHGGLIRCEVVNGNLYHVVGGHVFNSKYKEVLEWFWHFFDQSLDFKKTSRNAVVAFDNNLFVKYPIENNVYQLPKPIVETFIKDMLQLKQKTPNRSENFKDFLLNSFGQTLYQLYFKPYNEKIWRKDLATVSLDWLDGKLPMPSIEEILYNNFCHLDETNMVHSSFFYPQNNGSQFIADRLAEGINIKYNKNIGIVEKYNHHWFIDGEKFDIVIFCGNIKNICQIINDHALDGYKEKIDKLEFHGTTSVFCEIDKNPYSWIYMPSEDHLSHRIICTGNFSIQNNNVPKDRITASIEFTDEVSKDVIIRNLNKIPLNPTYITHRYTKYTYPIQDSTTRIVINTIKKRLELRNFYLLGRFAEWEYYNMDTAIKAAMELAKRIETRLDI